MNAINHSTNPRFRLISTFRYLILTTYTIAAFLSLPPDADARTWTRASDGRKIEADFLRMEGDLVVLKLPNGSIAKVPKATFIPADIAAIADLRSGLGDRSTARNAARQIDALLAVELKKQGFTSFNPPLTDDLFARRVYLDIIGRIPTREEFDAFVKSRKPGKREALIDELLTHPGYAHHAFNYFADMYRFGSYDLNFGVRLDPYYQWWREHLAANTPYDEIVRQMVTAKGNIGQNPASGFILRDSGMFFDAFSNFSQVMLGIDISCAQCHDHPFQDTAIEDFYGMAAYFQETRTRGGGPGKAYTVDGKKYFTFLGAPERWMYDDVVSKLPKDWMEDRQNRQAINDISQLLRNAVSDTPGQTKEVPDNISDEYEDLKGQVFPPATLIGKPATPKAGQSYREALAQWLTEDDNPRFALAIANRMWDRAFGLPLVGPVHDVTDTALKEASQPEALKFVTREMKRLDYDLREFMRILHYTRAYQSKHTADQPDPAEPYYFQGPLLRRMRAEQIWDSLLVLARGPEIDGERGLDGSVYRFGSDFNFEETFDEIKPKIDMWVKVRRPSQSYLPEGSTTPTLVKNPEFRASVMEQPARAGHTLDTFGQSDRQVTDEHTYDGSVPQVLSMMNGEFTEKLTDSDSELIRALTKPSTVRERANAAYHAILSRNASPMELNKAEAFLKKNGDEGLSDLTWALINNPEFLFIR